MSAIALAGLSLSWLLAAAPPAEEPKRQKPEVQTPVEFRTAVVRAQVRSHIFQDDGKNILVIRDKPMKDHAFVPIDRLDKQQDIRLANKVLPIRMVLVVASFPLQKQVKAFQRSLHLAKWEDAFRELSFAGFTIERRDIGPDAKPTGKWNQVAILDSLREVARLTGTRFAYEDPALQPVILPGLVFKLPEQFEDSSYPRPERELSLLTATLKQLNASIQEAPRDANPFGQKPEKETKQSAASPDCAEYCLARFVDVTVNPGKSYEYRLQVRMHNPNFKRERDVASPELAKDRFLESAWIHVPGLVTVPPDFAFYAVDQKELDPKHFPGSKPPGRDEVAVQLHRWLDFADSNGARRPEPVGDWAIAERVLISAGEYIGGTHAVELPIWSWFDERFVLATTPEDRKLKQVPIAFTEEKEVAPPLVYFEGGEIEFKGVKERVPRELLVLMPNGRLAARNSATDMRDAERREYHQHWRKRVDAIKSAGAQRK